MEGQIFHHANPIDRDTIQFLERKGVRDILQRSLQGPMTTVVAGEGYGKTYTIYSFLQKYDGITIWLQLSERDNLEQRLWENYTGAVKQISEGFASDLAELGFPDTVRQFDRYIDLLKNNLDPGKRYIIVLDDFHLIQAPKIIRFLERAVAALRQDTSLILISRREPAINTVSLLSKGFLVRITAEDLRFSKKEIEDYFALQNILLSGDELTRIYADTEGWALALNLIAREIKQQKGGEKDHALALIKSNTFKAIEGEIFLSLQEELQIFLVKLSLVEHWHSDLLEKLSPDKNNIEELNTLEFFVRYDAYSHGYRIHPLFVDFLREKQSMLAPEEIRDVYDMAAQWCLDNNLRMDAASYYERAEDYPGIISLVNSFPQILPIATAAFFLEIADRMIPRGDPTDGDLLYLRWVTRPKLLMALGRFDESTAENHEAIAQFEKLPSSPLHSRILCACYGTLGTISLLACRFTKDYNFTHNFERADYYFMQYPEPVHGPVTQSSVSSYVTQLGYPAEPGEFEKAIDAVAPSIPHAVNFLNGYLYGQDTLARAELAYFRGDLISAEKFSLQAVFQGREKKQYEVENRALFFLLRIALHTGAIPVIQELFRQLASQLETGEFLNRHTIYDIASGWFYAHAGVTGRLAPWLRNDFEESELNTLFYGFETLVKAKCFFAEKKYEAVLNIFEHSEHKFGLESYLLGKLEMTVLAASAYYRLGEIETALMTLENAYYISFSNSLNMPFIELGEDMRRLTGAALKSDSCAIPKPWLKMIRSKASAYGKKLILAADYYQNAGKNGEKAAVYLSRREQKILGSLSQGLTREEIAEETTLSLNTVKGVIKSIYNKLGAINRADAVRIASDIGILKNPVHSSHPDNAKI
ncbi:MAG: LuxR C-terminal-related transcriptional regulator [Treponema sp.]|jgi:LuxR family maltose regulon positive regulatory protein|nr:LuxR C-terminal-related transcriptional regulator [Treponema sp.]